MTGAKSLTLKPGSRPHPHLGRERSKYAATSEAIIKPASDESGIQLRVELACRIIGDIQKPDFRIGVNTLVVLEGQQPDSGRHQAQGQGVGGEGVSEPRPER